MRRLFSAIPASYFCASLLIIPAARAETPPKVGRLPDGRAYRVDENGYRLTDHIAELEMTVTDLQNQVQALEFELEQRTRSLEAAGKPIKGSTLPLPARTPIAAQTSLPAPKCEPASLQNCDTIASSLKARIHQLENDLVKRPETCLHETTPLHEQISALQNALMSSPSKEQLARELSSKQALANDLEKQSTRVSELNGDVSSLAAENDSLKNQLSALEEELERRSEAETRLSSRPPAANEAARARLQAPAAPVIESDPEELASIRSTIGSELTAIQSLIVKRKDMYDALRSKEKSISFQLQPLVSSRGTSLDALRAKRTNIVSVEDGRRAASELKEIIAVLNGDISLIERIRSRS